MKNTFRFSSLLLVLLLSACGGGGGASEKDSDGDGVVDSQDAFINDARETTDTDGDGTGDNGDNCPVIANADQLNTDGDAQGDACDTDSDNDTILNEADNCPLNVNTDQLNTDGDDFGNACDTDSDNDTVLNESDNCPLIANTDQINIDADSLGDACDGDNDNDTVLNEQDNCPTIANSDQLNTDADAFGDVCDADMDNDTVLNEADNCPLIVNTNQLNTDGDVLGDVCDADMDGDTILNAVDNCPLIINTDQLNTDAELNNGDTLGNACDNDDDGDGVLDDDDEFKLDPTEYIDSDGDGTGDNEDPNDDNDAKLDINDPFQFDPTEWEDIDEDEIGDNKDLDVGNSNPAAAQLPRFFATDRATLFIGADNDYPSGSMVVTAGDVNGDKIDDLLVGVSESDIANGNRSGAVYLFFGGGTPWPAEIDLTNIPSSVAHIVILGSDSVGFVNRLGSDVAALGDVNSDGIEDFLLGGPTFKLTGALSGTGEAYLVFGRQTWLADAGDDHIITMAELKSQYAITYQGQKAFGYLGKKVAAVGDVNGDEINDFLISEYGYDQSTDSAEGRVHLMFGGDHLQPPVTDTSGILNIDTLPEGTSTIIETHRIDSDVNTLDYDITILGEAILGLGNFDNDPDNLADIAITSAARNKVYVLFGQETWPAVINLPTIENGKGFIFEAPAANSDMGIGQHIAAGDLNGDNIPELIIAQTNSTDAELPNKQGDVVILKGGVGNWPATLSMDNISDFFAAIWSTTEKLALGSGLAVLPDNNNDGLGELLISAPNPDAPSEGLIFKVAGHANLAAKQLNSTTTEAGVEIIRNLSTDVAAQNMRTLGDYNGDGINEFVIDIPEADATPEGDDTVRTDNGLFYVIQGYGSLYPE